MSLLPRRLRCSLTSIYRAVFPPKLPSTRNWLVREMNGVHRSSISAQLRQLPISLHPRKSPGNLLINILVPRSMTEKAPPQQDKASVLRVASPVALPPTLQVDNNNTAPAQLTTVVLPEITPRAIPPSIKVALSPSLLSRVPKEDTSPLATTVTGTNPA